MNHISITGIGIPGDWILALMVGFYQTELCFSSPITWAFITAF